MSTLRELQRDFAAAALQHAVPSLLPHLHGPQPEARTLLYANTVYGTLTKALEAVYQVVARLVGGRCFDGLARRFIRQVPSRGGDLHQFGGEFADFLAATPLAEDHPYLPDVARLEWAVHRMFHARDSAPLDVRRLGGGGAGASHATAFQPGAGQRAVCRALSRASHMGGESARERWERRG